MKAWLRVALVVGVGGLLTVGCGPQDPGKVAARNVARVRVKADRGDAKSQCELGMAYAEGKGVTKDPAEALKWYRKAAEQGDAEAQYRLGMALSRGEGVSEDQKRDDAWARVDLKIEAVGPARSTPTPELEEVTWLRRAADRGHAEARYQLGEKLAVGDGARKDLVEATKWTRKAAEQGHVEAQWRLGGIYQSGRRGALIGTDMAEALSWYRKAAEQDVGKQWVLAGMLEDGDRIPKDAAEAERWFRRVAEHDRKAAEQGDPSAQQRLGCLHAEGKGGVPKSADEAARWLRRAAEGDQGRTDVTLCVAHIFGGGLLGVPKNQTDAARWFRMYAEKGDCWDQKLVGEIFLAGDSVERDSAEGLKWLEEGYVRMGKNGAHLLWSLGDMLLTGSGNIPKNPAEGTRCLAKAAELGGAEWMWKLGEAYAWVLRGRMSSNSQGVTFPQDPYEAARWFQRAAEKGTPEMQFELGKMFGSGGCLRKVGGGAVKWYRKAAEQGHVGAQCNLGVCYVNGDGVPKDEVEALAWFNIAAASEYSVPKQNRAIMEARLGPRIAVLAQQRSKELLKVIEEQRNRTSESSGSAGSEGGAREEPKGTGSGVCVTTDGVILSAAHVVQGCTRVRILTTQGVKKAKVLRVDEANDVVLLKCEGTFAAAPIVSSGGVRLGQAVFTVGFPNVGIQGFEPKITKGEISSMGGIQDDPRQWQISAPVQPGNSGGGLFDEYGNVVGVVVAKLDPLKTARISGDIPQNVNYAVKSAYVLPLLESMKGSLPSPRKAGLSGRFEDVVQKVRESVVLVVGY